jgi:hypothetical protein
MGVPSAYPVHVAFRRDESASAVPHSNSRECSVVRSAAATAVDPAMRDDAFWAVTLYSLP